MDPADVVIVEGILVLAMAEVCALLNMKVFVDTDDDVRLARRIQRDVSHRGRDVAGGCAHAPARVECALACHETAQ